MNTQEATAPASTNGAAPEPLPLPVDSFREAAPFLRRPFTPQAVKFKVQASWAGGALIVGYIDARLAVERLNLVCPHLWHDAYEPTNQGLMWCHLTVDGITRSDVGEGKGKGLVSDALKRAGVKFGIGVSLYALPKMILNDKDGHLKRKQRQGREDTVELTPTGEARVREVYRLWLDTLGRQAFGDPLDHGDAEHALGDPDEHAEPEPTAEPVEAQPVTIERAKHLAKGAKIAGWDAGRLRQEIAAVAGRDLGEIRTQANAVTAVRALGSEGADQLEARIEAAVPS